MKNVEVSGTYNSDGSFNMTSALASGASSEQINEWNTITNILKLKTVAGEDETSGFPYSFPAAF